MRNLYNKITCFNFPFCLILCILFLLHSGITSAQYWMQRAGSTGNDEGLSISLDDSNNSYTTGYFSGYSTFGNTVLHCTGITDIFLTKTNSLGLFQWAVKAGDYGPDRGLAVKTDANGNSYITGYYFGTAIFGKDTIKSVGEQDIFVAKYDRNGNIKWVVSAGGTQSDIGNAITIDNSGNVIITGQFTDTAHFGSYTLISVTGFYNVFTAKLDSSNGNFLWAKAGTGNHNDRGLGVACDPAGNVYVTGQFTDTVTFDNTYYTTMYGAIFIVKYDNTGKEVWFTKAGGGIFNIVTAIAVDNNSNVFITGSFTGDLFFFANKVTVLTNIYSNKIFIAKYDQNANLLWDVADGSDNPLNANSISLDGSGNPYIIGNFECVMNGYADKYGQGTFNTVGYWDIYASEYSGSNGVWQWSRQIGGHKNNYGYAIAVSPATAVYTAGSFDDDMILPWDNNYLGYKVGGYSCSFDSIKYCSDSFYYDYRGFMTAGDLDIFIAKPFDLKRETYDYYFTNGRGCNRSYVGVCINNIENASPGYGGCFDTIKLCGGGFLNANSQTDCRKGPFFNFLWSDNTWAQYIRVSFPGKYWVTQTSEDGCFVSTDTVIVTFPPYPAQPTISDNVVINKNATQPVPIHICKDSVTLTGGNYDSNKFVWVLLDIHGGHKDSSASITLYAPDSAFCAFEVTGTDGCEAGTDINVVLDSAFPPIVPALKCTSCKHDTAYGCGGGLFSLLPYDTLSNPNAMIYNCIPPYWITLNYWYVTPNNLIYFPETYCGFHNDNTELNSFIPPNSGWYYITDSIKRSNACGGDVHVVSDSIYVRIYPDTANVTITLSGSKYVCPGDSTWWKATTNGTKYKWSYGSTIDSVYFPAGSNYSFISTLTNSYGCSSSKIVYFSIYNYTGPTISMEPAYGLVCPGDSVEILCTNDNGVFTWYGPNGPFGGNINNVYVKEPGQYFCTLADTAGCNFISNTVQVNLYSTPWLLATPSQELCPGDTATLLVIAEPGYTLTWLPPFSGSDTIQHVTTSGTYSCQINSCNIQTVASVTITFANPKAIITPSPGAIVCHANDTVILTANDTNVAQWLWEPGYLLSQKDTVTALGTYTLLTIDDFGCSASSSITISLPQPFDDSILSQTNLPCFEDNKGSAALTFKGGIPAYTYSWSNHSTGSTISGLSAGIYTVSVQDKCGSSTTASLIKKINLLLFVKCISNLNVLTYFSRTIVTANINCATST